MTRVFHSIVARCTDLLGLAPNKSFSHTILCVDLALKDFFAGHEAWEILVVLVEGIMSELRGEDHSWLHVVVVLRHGTTYVDLNLAEAHFRGCFGFGRAKLEGARLCSTRTAKDLLFERG